jgi:hypothetical protein
VNRCGPPHVPAVSVPAAPQSNTLSFKLVVLPTSVLCPPKRRARVAQPLPHVGNRDADARQPGMIRASMNHLDPASTNATRRLKNLIVWVIEAGHHRTPASRARCSGRRRCESKPRFGSVLAMFCYGVPSPSALPGERRKLAVGGIDDQRGPVRQVPRSNQNSFVRDDLARSIGRAIRVESLSDLAVRVRLVPPPSERSCWTARPVVRTACGRVGPDTLKIRIAPRRSVERFGFRRRPRLWRRGILTARPAGNSHTITTPAANAPAPADPVFILTLLSDGVPDRSIPVSRTRP